MPFGQQQNIGQVQVIDPILTTYVQGYKQPNFVGNALFPLAPVPSYQHTVITFGREAFRLYNTRRFMGSGTKRIFTGRDSRNIALQMNSIETGLPREEMTIAQSVGITGTQTRKLNTAMRVISLGLENDQAAMARNAINYGANNKVTLSGTSRWSQAGSKPLEDFEQAKQSILDQVGIEPNTVVISNKAWRYLKHHPDVIERIKYTSRNSVTTEMVAELIEIPRIEIGKGVYVDAQDNVVPIWGADVIVAYVPERAGTFDIEEPSYGYTYHPEGHPLVETAYFDNNTKTWYYGVTFDREVNLTGMDAGFLIQNAGDDS